MIKLMEDTDSLINDDFLCLLLVDKRSTQQQQILPDAAVGG